MPLNSIFFNRYFDKNRLKALILWSLTRSGEKTTIDLVEKLKDFGFYYATQAGLSLGIDDLKIPPAKSELILEAEVTLQSSQKNYEIGNVTIVEKFQQLIDVWHRTSEILKQNVVHHFRSTDILNPVYMMAFSGARGNISQVRQLVGMRGLMADPQGQILDFPIRSNFREGLTLTEYVISCYGARKGLVDTALRTANSGYLTRRLVDVAQHIIVRQVDCGTTSGILITEMKDGKKVIFSLQKRLIGRVLAEPIETIARVNQDISPALSLKIVKLRNQVLVRSPLSCEAKNSICQLCYGWSLAHGSLVSLGEAVGILAAQSIGEPGTQLTMRTFHTGGVFSGDVMQEIRSPFNGKVTFSKPLPGMLIRTLHGKIAFLTKIEGELTISSKLVLNFADLGEAQRINYNIPVSTVLFIRESEYVQEKQLLAEYSSVVTTNNQGIQANYNLSSNIEGQVYFEDVLLVIKSGKEGDVIKTALKFGSIWVLSGKLYQSSISSNLFSKCNDLVDTKSLLNESVFVTPYSGYLETYSEEKTNFTFFNKKNSYFFNQNSYLKNLVMSQKNTNNVKSIFPVETQKDKLHKELFINQSFIQIDFQKIQYKKFGYFISLRTSVNDQLFLRTSLNEKNIDLKDIGLQWLSKRHTPQKGLIFFDQNFFQEEKGQFYLIPNIYYKIQLKKILNIHIESSQISRIQSFQVVQKNQQISFLKNKQANIKPLFSKKTGFLNNFSKTKKERTKLIKIKFRDKNFLFIKNPNIKSLKLNNLKEKNKIQKKKLKQFFIPFNSKINKIKIRNKNFNYQKFQNRQISLNNFQDKHNFSKNIYIKPEKNDFLNCKQKKINFFNFTINSGWNFLPKESSQLFLLNKNFLTPTYKITTYHFDQNPIFIRPSFLKNFIFFFFKTNNLFKIRHVNNKFFRYNKVHFYIKEKFNKNDLVTFFKKEKTLNLPIINLSGVNQLIVRNKIYKKNFMHKTLFLVEIEKVIELKNSTQLEQKKIFQKISKIDKNFKFFNVRRYCFNKQKSTKLKNSFPSLETKIETINFHYSEKYKIYLFNTINIYFWFSKNSSINKAKLKLEFGQRINFLINRKVESVNYKFKESINGNKTKSKVLLTTSNKVLEQNVLTINSFLSPYQGEITTVKTDLTGKEKSLVLTSKNKISFLVNQKPLLVKIGQLVRYGDQILKNITISESGQIILIDKNKITLRKAQPILFSSQGVFHVDNGDIIEKNTPVITLFYQKLKTEDIVQGIPKIEELFEARQTKEGETLQENLHTKLSTFFNFYKQQYIPQEAARKSIEKIQQILVNNVQKVYQSQGVSIADKHIEIIVRQMTTKVKITESGRTGLLRGELIDLEWVEIINLGIAAQNQMTNQGIDVEKAEYEPIILGITKAALETESFISASSFQETTRILSRAAIERKTDFLRGLKENVILGHLIPAGTGFSLSFDSQNKTLSSLKKISWLSYKQIIKTFSR